MENYYNYKVCVLCLTYNQSAYIIDTLNGFCMQETTFPFVCTIVDDASTDGEQEVIKRYLQENFDIEDESTVRYKETDDYILTFARHKTNRNCYFAVLFLKYNHYRIQKDKMPYISEWSENVEYHATCEGDDYWIDSHKLQKQVDFLDKNPDYVLCCHETKRYNQNSGEMFFLRHKILDKYPEGFSFDSSYDGWEHEGWLTQTLTNLFRANYEGKNIYMSMTNRYDVIFMFFMKRAGKCFLMPDVMSVYRIHNGGICSGTPFVTFYFNILRAFEELNKKMDSPDAREALRRHVRVNIGNLILLREWVAIKRSIRIVNGYQSVCENVIFLFSLFFNGMIQVTRVFIGAIKTKLMGRKD